MVSSRTRFRAWGGVVWAARSRHRGWAEDDAHQQRADEAADDDDGEGTLRVGADAVRYGRGQQAEGGDQHGHHDGTEAEDSALDGGIFDGVSTHAHLVDVLEHDDADLDRDAEESRKPTPEETLKWSR